LSEGPENTPSASLALAATCAAVALWGLAPVGTRFIVQRVDPLALLALRFSISALAFLPVLIHSRLMGWTRKDLKLGIACGIVGIVGYGLPVTIGQQWTTASTTGLILASEPIWILLIWALFERRRPGFGAGLGAFLGLVGVGLLFGGGGCVGSGVPWAPASFCSPPSPGAPIAFSCAISRFAAVPSR
jgi:drug/metabolite transporter (DMT)-like permease